MPLNLTSNGIPAILAGDLNSKPLLQVLDINIISTAPERYRFLLSDSLSSHYAMIATQLNDRVKSNIVRKGSVVQLIEYSCTTIQNRKIIIALNMEIIVPSCEIIGNPKMYAESETVGHNPVSNVIPQRTAVPSTNYSTAKNVNNNTQTFRPTVQPAYQPPPVYKSHGAILKNEAPARTIPIAALNPYQGRWAIKARVTAKGDLRRYNNAKGDGKVFSFDLLDSDGGEIRVTCFNAVVDRFYDTIEVGKVYMISKGSLKPAKKNFNHLNNEWEIFLESSSTIDLCPDEDASSIPQQQFSFRPISEIETVENNSIIDVIGVVMSVEPCMPIMRKNGMETQKRTINLKDESGRSVELTLWGEFCNREGQKLQQLVVSGSSPVLAVKAGKVNDFSGRSIGTVSSTQLFIDPDSPEANNLRHWFDKVGRNIDSQSISRDLPGGLKNDLRKTVSQIKDEGLGRSKTDWVTVKATVTFVKTDNFCYTACPLKVGGDKQCNKKVARSGSSKWQCDRCNQEFEECDYRYLLQCQVQDHTGLTWVTAFQEPGEKILGCPAKDLYMMKYEARDDDGFANVIKSRLFSEVLLKLKINEEPYGEEQRLKITVVKVDYVNYSSNTKFLLDSIPKSASTFKVK
ncbi:replication protein A 70 kDa DNA-binding subunit A [Rutidosis leptorrhynchoides]|uniref:replication protein A 70 kDa DNA-binding subunit A n=1 Tax=Rutidosis leptorrhynchoides TaxID=125765 RepID=UPI003A99AF7D